MSGNVIIKQILLKRGNTAAASAYTGPIGEVVIDTTLKTLRIQDGVTAGGTIISTGTGTYGNANVYAFNSNIYSGMTAANTNIGTLQTQVYSNTNVAAYIPTSSVITAINANVAGANAAIVTANTELKNYTDSAISTAINNLINSAPGTLDTLGEIAANLAADAGALSGIVTSITAINANVTAANVQITGLSANAAAQESSISDLRANITAANSSVAALGANVGGFYTWANTNFGTSNYSDSDVATYLANFDGTINFVASPAIISGVGSISTVDLTATGNVYTANLTAPTYQSFTISADALEPDVDVNQWVFDTHGTLNMPGAWATPTLSMGQTSNEVQLYTSVGKSLSIQSNNGSYSWNFGTDGNLYLPAGHHPGNEIAQIFNVGGIVGTTASSGANISGFSYINSGTFTAGRYLWSNGVSILDGIGGTYSNTNAAAYLTTATIATTGNITASNIVVTGNFYGNIIGAATVLQNNAAGTFSAFIDSQGALRLPTNIYGASSFQPNSSNVIITFNTGSPTVTWQFWPSGLTNLPGNVQINTGNIILNNGSITTANNITAVGNITGRNFLFANGVNILSTVAASSTYSNTNVAAYLSGNIATGNITSTGNITASSGTIYALNVSAGQTTISAANGTTVLTNLSTRYQTLTGTGGQTFQLPDATTLTPGTRYVINNNATSTINVNYNDGTLLCTIGAGAETEIINLTNTTSNGTWDRHGYVPSYINWGSSGIDMGGAYITNSGNVTLQSGKYFSGNAIGTTAAYSGNVTATYFLGNGSALTGITANAYANVYGTSSNVTLIAGTYSSVFDNTGNVTLPGNLIVSGSVKPTTYQAGQVIKTTMLAPSDMSINSDVSTTGGNVCVYSYTPASSSSYIIVEFNGKWALSGSNIDSWYANLYVAGTQIGVGHKSWTQDSADDRSGQLLPVMGRYTNSDTGVKAVYFQFNRDSSDDTMTMYYNSNIGFWLKITEIAR